MLLIRSPPFRILPNIFPDLVQLCFALDNVIVEVALPDLYTCTETIEALY